MKQFALFLFMLLVARLVIGQTPKQALAFTHGEGNLGYKCYFYSHTCTSQGVVLMTNGNDGLNAVFELMRTVSDPYKWPKFKSIIKKTIRVSMQKLAARAREYTLKNRTNRSLRLTLKDNSFLVKQVWNDMEYTLCLKANLEFFVKEYGDLYTFDSAADGSISSVNYGESKWIKVK